MPIEQPLFGGIKWAFRLEGVDQDKAIEDAVEGENIVVYNEAQKQVCKELIAKSKKLNEKCEYGMRVNAWAVKAKKNLMYYPFEAELFDICETNDYWLRRKGDNSIVTISRRMSDGSYEIRNLFDITNTSFQNLLINLIMKHFYPRISPQEFNTINCPDFVFLDECHRSLRTMSRLSYPETDLAIFDGNTKRSTYFNSEGVDNSQSKNMARFIRLLKAQLGQSFHIMKNGTMNQTGVGIWPFHQNSEGFDPIDFINQGSSDCWGLPLSIRKIVFQFNKEHIGDRATFYLALCHLVDSHFQLCDKNFVDSYNEKPVLLKGQMPICLGNGEYEHDENGLNLTDQPFLHWLYNVDGDVLVGRQFERGYLTVNINNMTYGVS